MNIISIFGYFLALIGFVLLITNSAHYTNINFIWVTLSLIVGLIIAFVGGALE